MAALHCACCVPAQVSAAPGPLRCSVEVSSRAGTSVRAVLGLGGPPASLRSASPGWLRSAPRSGPLPHEDGCRTPGPQLLPLPGAILRPRTLLSRAAANGRSRRRTPSAPPRGGGAEGAPRAPRPRPAGPPAWQKLRKIVILMLPGQEMMMKRTALLRQICRHNSRCSELSGCLNSPQVEARAV